MRRTLLVALGFAVLGTLPVLAADAPKPEGTYLKRAEAEIQEWTEQLKSIQARSEKGGEKTRKELAVRLKSVDAKLSGARKNLEQLRQEHAGTIKSVRETLEETLSDVKHDLSKLIEALNKNDKKEKS